MQHSRFASAQLGPDSSDPLTGQTAEAQLSISSDGLATLGDAGIPHVAAGTAAAPCACSSSRSRGRHALADERLLQAWDGLALAVFVVTMPLDIALCLMLFHKGEPLLWAAMVCLAALVAPATLLCIIIVHRLQWMAVALRFCRSMLSFGQGSVLEFGRVKWLAPRLLLRWVALLMFVAVGGAATLYLSLCYMVTALLSLPVLDLAAAVSLLPQRRHFQRGDLVFIENYKAARLLVHAAMQSTPIACVCISLIALRAGAGVSELGAAARRVPLPLLVLVLAAAVANVAQRAAQLLWHKHACGASLCAHLHQVLKLRGATRVPPYVTEEALAAMLPEGGRKLCFSNVWYWAGDAGSSGTDAAAVSARMRLPLIPRYLFPADGGWLVPGQLSRLAHLAFVRYGGSDAVTEWELQHLGGQDLGPLLVHGLQALPGLRCLTLHSCKLNGRAMRRALPLLTSHTNLRRLRLTHCTISHGAAVAISELLAASTPLALLQVSRCSMPGMASAAIARGLAHNRSLLSLNFSGNGVGKVAAVAFASALGSNGTLRHLNLAFNRLCPSGGELLARCLASSTSLERLVLQRKEIGQQGLGQLVAVLRERTGTAGPLTLCRHPTLPLALALQQLPITFLSCDDLDTLTNEQWLDNGSGAAPAPLPTTAPHSTTPAAVAAATPASAAPVLSAADIAAAGSSAAARLLAGARSAGELSVIGEEAEGSLARASTASVALSLVQAGRGFSQDISGVTCISAMNEEQGMDDISVIDEEEGDAMAAVAHEPPHVVVEMAAVADAAAGTAVTVTDDEAPDIVPCGSSRGRDQDVGQASSSRAPGCKAVHFAAKATSPFAAASAAVGASDAAPAAPDTPAADPAASTPAGAVAAASAAMPAGNARAGAETVCCPSLVLLSQNELCDAVAAALRGVEGLAQVDVAGLQLGDRGARTIAAALPSAPALTHLRLSGCTIFDDGAAAIATALRGCSALQQLDLSHNTVCDEAAAVLCGVLEEGGAPVLTRLSLADNRYPFSWDTLARLQRLTSRPGLPRLTIELVALPPGLPRPPPTAVAATADAQPAGVAAGLAAGAAAAVARAAAVQVTSSSRPPSVPASPSRVGRSASSSNATADANSNSSSATQAQALRQAMGIASASPAATGSYSLSCSHPRGNGHHRRGASAGSGTWSVASEDLCGVCFDRPNHLHVKDCGHRLCIECYRELCRPRGRGVAAGASAALCPFCRGPISGFVYAEWPQQAAAGL